MSLDGYHLRGVSDDYLLVFRSGDPEAIERIIARLCASRDKEIRALAENLELTWNERLSEEQRNNTRKIKDPSVPHVGKYDSKVRKRKR